MSDLEVRAPAKVNLFLRVLARERSGYHGLETLFCGLDLADSVRISSSPSPGVELEVDGGFDVGPMADNLVVRAARGYLERAGLEGTGIRVALTKRIPPGTGLGGGSSDAAATLRGMDRLFGGALPGHRILELGAELGSDVPFFLSPSPLALAWSRGERLMGLPPLPPASVLVARSGPGLSTAEAYGELARVREGRGGEPPDPRILTPDDVGTWRAVAALAVNDFEPVVFRRREEVRALVADLRELGASPALLAGSGAACFGVFADPDRARHARKAVEERRPDAELLIAETLEEWPTP